MVKNDYTMRKNPDAKMVNKLLDLGYKIIAIKHGTRSVSNGTYTVNSEEEVFMHFLRKEEEETKEETDE